MKPTPRSDLLVHAPTDGRKESVWQQLLVPLLIALQWKGGQRHVQEVLPERGSIDTLANLREVMLWLGYDSHLHTANPHQLDQALLPALHLQGDNTRVLANQRECKVLPDAPARLLIFTPLAATAVQEATLNGLRRDLRRFSPVLNHILLLSFIIGALALAPTFFNMVLYDNVINSGATRGLGMITFGVFLALFAELAIRQMRNQKLAWFGGRIDHFVSSAVFERLMFLQPALVERASISSQLARLRDFEAVREFFTGPLATLVFEMPLVLMYVVAMAFIGGWLAAIPLVLLVCYVLLLLMMGHQLKEQGRDASAASTRKHEFLMEAMSKMRALRLAGMENTWQQRFRRISAEAAHASFRAAFTAQLLETICYAMMTVSGVATLAFGVHMVIAGTLSTGALIAAMMLIWRIATPLQICCASITRFQQLQSSTKQVQHLLSVPPERNVHLTPSALPGLRGHITFSRVSLRYGPDQEPALLGVTLDFKPGHIVAIKGGNGSGKSTLLKSVLGMTTLQAGAIRLDGVDIRQFDPLSLRQAIAYVPQMPEFFPGSVRDNLLRAAPAATEDECRDALAAAGILEEAESMPQGLDTLIAGNNAIGASFLFRQRLNLARGYIKNSPVLLIDEGAYSPDTHMSRLFGEEIAKRRGHCTVMIVTHREDHMLLADTLVVMNKGEVTHMGPPDKVLAALQEKK